MVTATASFGVPGPISGMTLYTAALTGLENFPLIAPPFGVPGSNYRISASLLASSIFNVLPSQSPNQVFAGPPSGIATAFPSFRSLVLLDLPQGTGGLPLVGQGATAPTYAVLGVVGGGSGLATLGLDGVLYGNGTSAVGVTASGIVGFPLVATPTPAFSLLGVVGGGTGTGTLVANGVLYGNGTSPLGVSQAGTAGFILTANGSALPPTFQAINLTASLTGVLSVTFGGTGASTWLAEGVLYGNGTNALGITAAGTSGLVLTGQGAGSAPVFSLVNLGSNATVTGILAGANMSAANLAASGAGGVQGNLPPGNLNFGSNAGTTTFWRGDGSWVTPSGGGNVIGPSSSTTNDILVFSGTNAVVVDSGFTIPIVGVGFGSGYVNKIRNGHMQVAQRGTAGTITNGSTVYTLDGWQITPRGANLSWQYEYNAEFGDSALRLNCAVGLTSVIVQQRIESYIANGLLTASGIAQNVVLQGILYNSTGTAFVPSFATQYPAAQDNFSSLTLDLSTTAVQTSNTGGFTTLAYAFVPNIAAVLGYQVQLSLGAALNTSAGFVDISRFDLRAVPTIATGLVALPPLPELRPLPSEMQLCQWYYNTSYGNGIAPGTATTAGQLNYFPSSGSQNMIFLSAQLSMRATPTIVWYSPNSGATTAIYNGTTDKPVASTNDTGKTNTGYPLVTGGIGASNVAGAHFTASAEL